MTSEEKKKYLSLQIAFQSNAFVSELEKKSNYISNTPKSLFKYRSFDKYTFDMLENEYVYLTPAGKLDDPFDCLTDIDINDVFEPESSNLTDEMMAFIFDIVLKHSRIDDSERNFIASLIDGSIINGKIDNNIVKTKLKSATNLSIVQKETLLNILININNGIEAITKDERAKDSMTSLMNSKKIVGVCSFTTNRDNKPMWSLYAKKYKGYCLEYEVPMDKETLMQICPVIYTKEGDNNIIKKYVEFGIEGIARNISSAKIDTNLGCITELLCTKDLDWESQDEWRLIGNADTKNYKFKLKNVYLGFAISRKNQDKILDLAKQKGFTVYKMDKPKGIKTISYTKL